MSLLGTIHHDLLLQSSFLIQSQVNSKYRPPGEPGITFLFPPPNHIQEVIEMFFNLSPVHSFPASFSPLSWSGPNHLSPGL